MIIRWNVARVLYFAGRYEEAIEQAEAVAAEGSSRSRLARVYQIQSYYLLEDYESIVALLRQDREDQGPGELPPVPSADEVPRLLIALLDDGPESPASPVRELQLAAAAWTRVNPDTAFARLAALASDPDDPAVRAVWFEVLADPMFDPLRDDPRYEGLNARFGL